ncbi:MAG: flavodoxin family protein [Anaerovoracaceae bacterium]
MGKKVIVISSSMRKDGNSESLAKEFVRGAEEAGHYIQMIYLREKDINFCQGCLSCKKTQRCVIKDDAYKLIEDVRRADAVVFATPIYFYTVCGSLKNFMDRMVPIYYMGNANFKDVYLLAAAEEAAPEVFEGAKRDVESWAGCFEGAGLAGTVFGGGLEDVGDIKAHTEFLQEAYNMGKNI